MSPTRRTFLAGAVLTALTGCGSPAPGTDRPGVDRTGVDRTAHPALRRPGRAGAVAFLRTGAAGPLRELRGEPDVLVGLGPRLSPTTPGLTAMPPFPGEVLLPERANTDAFLQVEGDDEAACADRLTELCDALPDAEVTWRTPVRRDTVDDALQRNPFGFVEGQTNDRSILLPSGEALLAVRVIRLAHRLWDHDTGERQSRIVGRRPDGTWLDGTPAHEVPDLAADPTGAAIPLDSHVRAMNPRTPGAPSPRMLRRSWSYQAPPTPQGTPDEGVLFMAFQDDYATGFALAQSRMPADALAPYLLAVGGGYFAVPSPG
ncbi:Dyp-type peroxidase domain-containing protein [Saccharothrix longispora]|uniref:Deferrochelatase/peroxidase EfeB n=1 Tax=Saccharothrix longispora TaxID=33920 RepID=A0ABU1PSB5_9PSEU|nr:Dyp-type peroxidase domain-containing protein [Saccharothrix longispora]MDR6593019.1 deferrochelatase/peroxidase EfeB [Saccharothrix longispora]